MWQLKLGLSAAFLVFAGLWIWDYGSDRYDAGYDARVAEEREYKDDIVEKRNEIANNRPDDATTIKRMQDGTF